MKEHSNGDAVLDLFPSIFMCYLAAIWLKVKPICGDRS